MIYMGSKSRIVYDLVYILQDYINKNGISVYIECFVGGANVIDKIDCKYRYGYDKNKYLIELLRYTRDNWWREGCFKESITQEEYIKVRDSYRSDSDEYSDLDKGIVGFLGSYNGVFFSGYRGITTTKLGKIRDYYRESAVNLLKQGINLEGIEFGCQGYDKLDLDTRGALIYCDPPYRGTAGYSVGKFDSDKFWVWVREMSKKNIVLVSEESAPDDFEVVWSKDNVHRSMKGTIKDGDIAMYKTEYLFRHKGY